MVKRLVDKLHQQRRTSIELEVRETNLAAQRFFAACHFRAVSVLPDHYEDTDEDAYRMVYSLPLDDLLPKVPGYENDGDGCLVEA